MMRLSRIRNIIPDFGKIVADISAAKDSVSVTLGSPRRRNLAGAFALAGALGGAAMCYGLSESLQENQMGIRGISAAQYDGEQVTGAALSAVFYGAAGTVFGFMAASLMNPVRQRRDMGEELSEPTIIVVRWPESGRDAIDEEPAQPLALIAAQEEPHRDTREPGLAA